MDLCPVCGRKLEGKALFEKRERWKACPKCSKREGAHVFLPYPDAFGTTRKRSTTEHPEGPQSECKPCRYPDTYSSGGKWERRICGGGPRVSSRMSDDRRKASYVNALVRTHVGPVELTEE